MRRARLGSISIIRQHLKCRLSCSMVAPILSYLKNLPGLVGLEIQEVGGRGLTLPTQRSPEGGGHGFTYKEAPILLDIFRTNRHLFHVKINTNGMTQEEEWQFVKEQKEIIATRTAPSSIEEFLKLEASEKQ